MMPTADGRQALAYRVLQKIFRKRRETKQVTDKSYPLWKKVRCGTCGRAMPFKDRIIRGRPYRYFGCPHSQAQVGDGGCSKGIYQGGCAQ